MTEYKARYTGRQRRHSRRGPSGERYDFQVRRSGPVWIDVDPKDADYFDRKVRCIDVQKKGAVEKTTDAAEGVVSGLLSAAGDLQSKLAEMGYDEKHDAADELGADVAGNASHDALDDAIRAQVDQMQDNGEI